MTAPFYILRGEEMLGVSFHFATELELIGNKTIVTRLPIYWSLFLQPNIKFLSAYYTTTKISNNRVPLLFLESPSTRTPRYQQILNRQSSES